MTDAVRSRRLRARVRPMLGACASLVAGAFAAMSAERLFADTPPAAPLARDEAFVVRMSRPASVGAFETNSYFVTRNGAEVSRARGTFVSGRPLLDPATGRQVVVRPEALREYFVLVRGLGVADADAEAARVLGRVERNGRLAPLDEIDAALRQMFGPTAGTRLDDPAVSAFYPPYGAADPADAALRRLVAGDDAKWLAYFSGGDIGAFATLSEDPSMERFYHPIETATGVREETSLLRQREHRRVLMRRARNAVTFLTEVPMRADLVDAGYASGATYELTVSKRFGPGVRDLVTERGGVVPFLRRVATFRVADDAGDGGPFLGGAQPSTTTGTPDPPRIVNVTPPSGETFIDRTTDWEDPDNQFTVPIPSRRLFVVRVRFSRPLDPRTVDAAHFTLTKTATIDALGNETPVTASPSAVGVWLSQSRMGEVLVEITPVTNLDPQSRYRLEVLGTVKGLDGTELGATQTFDL
jgi:Big-like domain-containing protein